jgi:uncharacterized membrane protein YdjX (TVP38/TMEM64 family)
MNKKTRIILMILIPAAVLLLYMLPGGKDWIYQASSLLSSMDVDIVKEYIRGFGAWAVIVSFLLMVFQSLAAPLPAFLITFANAAVFGWGWGALLSWSSAMVGAALCFGIAKLYGRTVVAKFTGNTALDTVDTFFDKYGAQSILVARLLPFLSFDIVSYAAGLTSMRFWPFFIATGLGQLPATLIYSYAGEMLGGGAKTFVTGLLIVFAVTALTFLIRTIYKDRIKKA